MKKKSLTMNAIMSGVRSILSILFPLITFPYVSRVLQVENLGKYNFANSVCAPAMEFRREGIVLGTGAKLFTIAGPVLVYGITASIAVGVVYWAIRGWLM